MTATVTDELMQLERATIGALVQAPDLRGLVGALQPAHFAVGRHSALLEVVDALVHVPGAGVTEVAAEIQRRNCHQLTGGLAYVHTCIEACPLPVNVARYAAEVIEAARRRRLEETFIRGVQMLQDSKTIDDALNLVGDELLAVRQAAVQDRPALDLDAFLNEADADRRWLLPGLLERSDRCIPTGEEGIGKSTLLRQIGHAAAAGVHPFTFEPVDPITVLIVDVENNRTQIRRGLRPLRELAKPEPGRLRIEARTEGLDLTAADDRAWLTAKVTTAQPDLLITGPIYKLISGDPIKEEPAREVVRYLDRLRADHDIALIIEAHTPYASAGARNRPRRPYGASIWGRWPELGLHLAKTGRLTHWRPSRGDYDWPPGLSRGETWPFVIDHTADVNDPTGPSDDLPPAARRVLTVLEQATPDDYLTVKTIGDQVANTGHPLKPRTIQNALDLLGARIDSVELDNRGTGAHRLIREPTP